MNFKYFVLLITLKNIFCYTTKRETPIASNLKHLKSKSSVPVTPARYQVVSKTNYEPVNTDYFPAVEHPSSVIEASKPFYITSSPFSNEVTTLFKSLSNKNSNGKSTIDYTWKPEEVQNEKRKELQKKENTDVAMVKEPKGINIEDKVMINEAPGNHAEQYTNTSTPTESGDIEYVIELIKDLDEFMRNVTHLEEECKENDNNTTVHAYESDCPNEFTTVGSVMMSNDSIIVFNGNSFFVEDSENFQTPLFEETDDKLNSTSMVDDGMTNISFDDVVDDMQANFCSIEKTFNESNSNISCTG